MTEEELEEKGHAEAALAAEANRKLTGQEAAQKKGKTASKPRATTPVTSGDTDRSDEDEEDDKEVDKQAESSLIKWQRKQQRYHGPRK